MPYSTLEEAKKAGFPTSAEDISLTIEQVNKLAEIYDAIKAQGNVDNAMAVAWTAWKRVYEKKGEKWVKREREHERKEAQMDTIDLRFFVNAELLKSAEHETILQTLERWIPRENKDTGKIEHVCYRKAAFERTLNDWNGVPIVYANEHPDMDLFAEDPDAALKKIDGRIVGTAKDARIETVGHPRLMVKLPITDKEVNERTDKGELSVSSGFYGSRDKDGHVISVLPQHILIFPETAVNQPVDHGSQILNMQTVENAGRVISEANAKELSGYLEKLQAFLKRLLTGEKPAQQGEPQGEQQNAERGGKGEIIKEEPEKGDEKVLNMAEGEGKDLETAKAELAVANSKLVELATAKEKLEADMAALTTEKAAKEEQIKNMQAEIEQYKQAQADAVKATRDKQFEELVNKHIPRGLTAKEEDKHTLRKEFDEDPHGFMLKVANMKTTPPSGIEGEQYQNAGSAEAGQGFHVYDPTTKQFKVVPEGH